MKGIKVIDVGTNPEYDVEFGTCEVCLSYGNEVDNPYMVLEFPDGTQAKVDTYYWTGGDYWESKINNVVDFSAWLSDQDLSDEEVEDLKSGGTHALIRLIDEYDLQLIRPCLVFSLKSFPKTIVSHVLFQIGGNR